MKTIFEFIIDNWLLIAPVIYEILSRVWPTRWNVSLLDNIWKIINMLVPNKRVESVSDQGLGTNARGEVVNTVRVKSKQHILHALLILCLFSSCEIVAQPSYYMRQLRFATGPQNSTDTAETVLNAGFVWYDFVTGRYRANFNGNNGFFGEGSAPVPLNMWEYNGNTVTSEKFLGTLDNFDLVFRRNNIPVFRVNEADALLDPPGKGNLMLGINSGINLSTVTNAYNNTFVGNYSGNAATTGYQNSFFGSRSGAFNTTGIQNTFLGQGAGYQNTTQNQSIYIGYHSGVNMRSAQNTVIGTNALQGSATPANNTGSLNVAIGYSAAPGGTTHNQIVAVGPNALFSISTASNIVAIGSGAGYGITTGGGNTFVGKLAGYTDIAANATTTGTENTFIGFESGYGSATQAIKSSAFGYRAKVSESRSMVFGSIVDADRVNYGFGGESYGTGQGVLYIKNAVTNPTTAIANGSLLFSDGGILKQRLTNTSYNVLAGNLTAARIPFASSAGVLVDETALQYLTANNQILLSNAASTHTTSIFGGEIQLDNLGGSDDVTFNNDGINVSGLAVPYEITSTSGIELTGNVTLSPTSSASQLYSSTYNPTTTGVTNVTSVAASSNTGYYRVGNMVTVFGLVSVDPTAAAGTETIWTQNLPIASTWTSTNDAAGTFSGREQDGSPVTQWPGQIIANSGINNEVRFSFSSSSTTDITFSYTFSYQIK